jgi:hypothetical protein
VATVIAKDGGHPAYRRLEGWGYPDGIRLAVNFTIDYDAQLNLDRRGSPGDRAHGGRAGP